MLGVIIGFFTARLFRKRRYFKTEELYHTITSSIPGSIIAKFDPEGRYQLIEGDMMRKIGYERKALLGKAVEETLPPGQAEEVREGIRRAVAGELYTIDIRRKNFDLLSRFVPLRDKKGTVTSVLAICIDITELKNAQRHITELNVNLEQKVVERTAQLEAANLELEAFSYSVSHDLRAPLRIIDGFAEILTHDYGELLTGEGQRLLNVVVKNARRMGQLIDDLLNLSRQGRKEMLLSPVDMNPLLRQVLEDEFAEKTPRIRVEDLGTCCCDPNLIKQVWMNLLSNALKYSGKRENPEVYVGSYVEGEEVVYLVRDNGVGFDMEYASKLFGIFQRLHNLNEFEGTGVGLALVQRIINRHGGRVWAEARVDEGATFFFSLPIINGQYHGTGDRYLAHRGQSA